MGHYEALETISAGLKRSGAMSVQSAEYVQYSTYTVCLYACVPSLLLSTSMHTLRTAPCGYYVCRE